MLSVGSARFGVSLSITRPSSASKISAGLKRTRPTTSAPSHLYVNPDSCMREKESASSEEGVLYPDSALISHSLCALL